MGLYELNVKLMWSQDIEEMFCILIKPINVMSRSLAINRNFLIWQLY